MSRRKGSRPPARQGSSSALADHAKRGKHLVPPLKQLSEVAVHSPMWLRDILPNMLWPLSFLIDSPREGMGAFARAIDLLETILAECRGAAEPPVLDGRLVTLEFVDESQRECVLARLREGGAYAAVFGESLSNLLSLYPDAPGLWLTAPHRENGLEPNRELADEFLGRIIDQAGHGQSLIATRSKMLVLRALFKHRKISIPRGVTAFDDLPHYPDGLTADKRGALEAVMRAAFSGLSGGDKDETTKAIRRWTEHFWRSNWSLYPCRFASKEGAADDRGESVSEVVRQLVHDADVLLDAVLERAAATDPDIFDPNAFEVLTGITIRTARQLRVMAATPILWSEEFGSPSLRGLVESLIVLRFLLAEEAKGKPSFVTFKDFGRGRLKLLKLHVEEQLRSLGDDAPQELIEYHEALTAEVNQDGWEEWQEIDLGGTFAGKDMREMAKELGMEDHYRFIFAPTSSTSHGEWTTLDRYALDRCINGAHMFHRMPRRERATHLGSGLMTTAFEVVEEIVERWNARVDEGFPRSAK